MIKLKFSISGNRKENYDYLISPSGNSSFVVATDKSGKVLAFVKSLREALASIRYNEHKKVIIEDYDMISYTTKDIDI